MKAVVVRVKACAKASAAAFIVASCAFCSSYSWAAEAISDYEQACNAMPASQCYQYIHQQLAQAPAHSTLWYKFKSYQFDYLYDTKQYRQLELETAALADNAAVPPVFRAQLLFYRVKALSSSDMDAAKAYARQVLPLLESHYQAFGEPTRLVEMANLYIFLQQHDTAEQLLITAKNQFRKSRDQVFWFELYSNFANIAEYRRDFPLACEYRDLALQATMQTQLAGKLMLANGNAARAHMVIGDADKAAALFHQAISYAEPSIHQRYLAKYYMRLARLALEKGEEGAAKQWAARVDASQFDPDALPEWQQLQQLLSQKAQH